MSGEDFVNVRLTEFGASLKQVVVHAGGTPDHASPAVNHREFVFKPGDVKRVTRAFEWEKVLRARQIDGNPLFEIVPADDRAGNVAGEINLRIGAETKEVNGRPEVIEASDPEVNS